MRKCLVNGCENRIDVLADEDAVCDECLSWFAIWEAAAQLGRALGAALDKVEREMQEKTLARLEEEQQR